MGEIHGVAIDSLVIRAGCEGLEESLIEEELGVGEWAITAGQHP